MNDKPLANPGTVKQVEKINRKRRNSVAAIALMYPGVAAICAENYLEIHNDFPFLSIDDVEFYRVMAAPPGGISEYDRCLYEQFVTDAGRE